MAQRLPALNALRAFEAAARHLSFAKAAAELHVTPAAISHQVKALEEDLGVPLFRRFNRQVLLTDAGQALAPGVRDGIDAMRAAVEQVNAICCRGPLTVTVPPSMASKWLLPRLERFRAREPEVDVRISATDRIVDLMHEDVDLAVRYGAGDYPGLVVEKLLDEKVFPVCAPALLEGPDPLRTPDDLARHTLLHDFTHGGSAGYPTWRMWLTAAGVVDAVDPDRGPAYDPSSMVVQAAVEGEGVALGRSVLVAADLAAGRLVKPFEGEIEVAFAYWVVMPPNREGLPRVAAFKDWLMTEAARAVEGEVAA
ncbi:MAG: transcriptional regulator GcvA [Azospirillaceae bacterium]